MSSPQVIPTVTVFDYVCDQTGVAVGSAKVSITLQYNQAVNTSPQVSISPLRYTVETDSNGYWQIGLAPNPNLTPSGTTYLVQTAYNSYEISVPASGGPYQATSILVTQPAILTPSTASVGALTATGLLTAAAGLTVAGAVTLPTASIPESAVANLTSDLSNVAHLGSTETFTGAKTFSQPLAVDGTVAPFTVQGRFLGLMSSAGPPAAGTWQAGDFGFDSNFVMWICSVGGTPGTWIYQANPGHYNADVYLNATTALSTTATMIIPYDTKANDPSSSFTTGASAGYTAKLAGRYLVTATTNLNAAPANTNGFMVVLVGGTSIGGGATSIFSNTTSNAAGDTVTMGLAMIARVSANQLIQIRAPQAGTAVNMVGGSASTFASFSFLGA